MYYLLLYLFAIELKDYAAFLYTCWFYSMMGLLICKYEPFWHKGSVKSLILRWLLRPVALLFLSWSYSWFQPVPRDTRVTSAVHLVRLHRTDWGVSIFAKHVQLLVIMLRDVLYLLVSKRLLTSSPLDILCVVKNIPIGSVH